jgi:hypothetical protein
MKNLKLSRRSMLRGVGGAAVALPFLEAMLDQKAYAAGEIPKRFMLCFGGHSIGSDGPGRSPLTQYHVPSVVGANYNLPQALAPLMGVKSHVSVVSGLKIPSAYDNGGSIPA